MALGSFFKERKERNMKKIKKIIIGLILGLILVFTIALTPQKVKAADTITNLNGYSWIANEELTILDTIEYEQINFISSSGNYSAIYLNSNNDSMQYFDTETEVYETAYHMGWINDYYRTIYFISDIVNIDLISWLEENGTLTITTSTINSGNYSFNNSIALGQTEFTGNVNINFSSNNQTFTGMRITIDTLYYANGSTETEVYNVGVGWIVTNSEYQKISIETPQEVTTAFYNWFILNANLQTYYTITFNRNGATSGDVPPLQDVLSGTTFDLNNYNPGNLQKNDSTFLGWNTDANATTPLSSIVVNSDVLLYAIFSIPPKSVNIKITCRDNVVWQGKAIFSNNKISGGVDWSNPTMTNVFFNNLDSQSITLINDKYGLAPNYANNQLLLFFRAFSTEKDENGRYLAFINLIKITTPKGSYAHNFEITQNPKNIDFEQWLDSESLTRLLNVDTDNYYFNVEISWSLDEPQPPGVAEWGNVATIMSRIMASVTTLLNINIGFITIGNLLLIVISLSVLFFVIKVWRGGN